MPLNAREAMRGSPSPWKVLAMMPKQARERERRPSDSADEREETAMIALPVHRAYSVFIAVGRGGEKGVVGMLSRRLTRLKRPRYGKIK
jgi:hypothetical protein